MFQDSEKMRALVAFKRKLEERVGNLESELAETKSTLEVVNSILLEKGFKRGEIKEGGAAPKVAVPVEETRISKEERQVLQRAGETENVIPLRTTSDEPLAIIYVSKDSMHVLPDESKNFSVNTPPFGNFLVERVLAKMQEKDNELVRLGQLTPDRMFAYTIVREGDLIREIVIKNVDDERLRELKSSIRWTLEKMYEKMKG
jgi:hypothetical protein